MSNADPAASPPALIDAKIVQTAINRAVANVCDVMLKEKVIEQGSTKAPIPLADGNGASILRSAEGNKHYSVRLKDLIKRGDVTANVEMRWWN